MENIKIITYPLQKLKPGMILAKEILDESGLVALDEGTVLTEGLIFRLGNRGIQFIDIAEWEEEFQEEWPFQTKDREVEIQYNDLVDKIQAAFKKMRYFKEVPVAEMQRMVSEDVTRLVYTTGIVNTIKRIKGHDDYTYNHSINVAVISGLLGRWIGMNYEEIQRLMLGGLLHDIGKSQVPLEILNKPGRLDGEELYLMRQHAVKGYQLIQDKQDVPDSVKSSILQHHERMDGSGYPFAVPGEKIHAHAKIIAVADIYDAITSERVYDVKRSPVVAVQELAKDMFGKLDSYACAIFLSHVQEYLLGNHVLLNNGENAEVVYVKPTFLEKPLVRSESGQFIDLERRKDIDMK